MDFNRTRIKQDNEVHGNSPRCLVDGWEVVQKSGRTFQKGRQLRLPTKFVFEFDVFLPLNLWRQNDVALCFLRSRAQFVNFGA